MMSRRISLRLAACLVFVAVPACSPGPVAVSSSPRDPSSPSAPEGVSPLLAIDAPSSAKEEAHDGTYVCPMHPEVTSTAAGRCPKCGMNLVPKK